MVMSESPAVETFNENKARLLTLDVIRLLSDPQIFGGPHRGRTTFNQETENFLYYYDQMAARGFEIIPVRPINQPVFIQLGPAAGITTPDAFGYTILAQPEIQLHALLVAVVQARNFSIGSEREGLLPRCIAELEQSLQHSAQHESLYFTLTSHLEIQL